MARLGWFAAAAAVGCASAGPSATAVEPSPPSASPPSAASHAPAPDTATPVATATLPAPAAPALPPAAVDPVAAVLALDGNASTSIGSPSAGKLSGGIALPDAGPGFVHNPKRPDEARFGTVEIVRAIVRAAAIIDKEMPGVPLVVNDIGLPEGGPIHQHGSHQNGRDADILFYSFDVKGAPLQSVGVPIDPRGWGWDFKDLTLPGDDIRVKLDARRTWRFMQALFEVAFDDIQRIFIVEHVRAMLLAEAKKQHAPARIVERFSDVTCQPGAPHDDHMHVRLWCSAEDLKHGCEDKPPLFPWRKQALAALGIEPVLAKAANAEDRAAVDARTTSPAEARAEAQKRGPMHAKVRRFLAEREAWRKQPHPGRTYCR